LCRRRAPEPDDPRQPPVLRHLATSIPSIARFPSLSMNAHANRIWLWCSSIPLAISIRAPGCCACIDAMNPSSASRPRPSDTGSQYSPSSPQHSAISALRFAASVSFQAAM
jgi:hypothetical protein